MNYRGKVSYNMTSDDSLFDIKVENQKWAEIISLKSIDKAKESIEKLDNAWKKAKTRDYKKRLHQYANLAANRAGVMAKNDKLKSKTQQEKKKIQELYRSWFDKYDLPPKKNPVIKIGIIKDENGNTTDLYTDGKKYYKSNPISKKRVPYIVTEDPKSDLYQKVPKKDIWCHVPYPHAKDLKDWHLSSKLFWQSMKMHSFYSYGLGRKKDMIDAVNVDWDKYNHYEISPSFIKRYDCLDTSDLGSLRYYLFNESLIDIPLMNIALSAICNKRIYKVNSGFGIILKEIDLPETITCWVRPTKNFPVFFDVPHLKPDVLFVTGLEYQVNRGARYINLHEIE